MIDANSSSLIHVEHADEKYKISVNETSIEFQRFTSEKDINNLSNFIERTEDAWQFYEFPMYIDDVDMCDSSFLLRRITRDSTLIKVTFSGSVTIRFNFRADTLEDALRSIVQSMRCPETLFIKKTIEAQSPFHITESMKGEIVKRTKMLFISEDFSRHHGIYVGRDDGNHSYLIDLQRTKFYMYRVPDATPFLSFLDKVGTFIDEKLPGSCEYLIPHDDEDEDQDLYQADTSKIVFEAKDGICIFHVNIQSSIANVHTIFPVRFFDALKIVANDMVGTKF